jgi:hypothetical protein
MGHDILRYRDRRAILNDWDLEAVRHFLLVASDAAGFRDVADFVGGWQYHCPGVWLGLHLDPFLDGDENLERRFCEVLDAARVRVLAFGHSIPSDYLEKPRQPERGQILGVGPHANEGRARCDEAHTRPLLEVASTSRDHVSVTPSRSPVLSYPAHSRSSAPCCGPRVEAARTGQPLTQRDESFGHGAEAGGYDVRARASRSRGARPAVLAGNSEVWSRPCSRSVLVKGRIDVPSARPMLCLRAPWTYSAGCNEALLCSWRSR